MDLVFFYEEGREREGEHKKMLKISNILHGAQGESLGFHFFFSCPFLSTIV